MTGKSEKMQEIVAAAVEAIPELREDEAKLYSRLRIDKTTLAYIWPAGKGTTRIDLYVSPESLPKSVKAFSAGRGRARKDGLIATLADSAGKREVAQVVEGLKVAAQFAKPTEEPKAETNPDDEFSADLSVATVAADAKSQAKKKTPAKA